MRRPSARRRALLGAEGYALTTLSCALDVLADGDDSGEQPVLDLGGEWRRRRGGRRPRAGFGLVPAPLVVVRCFFAAFYSGRILTALSFDASRTSSPQ